MLTNLQSAIDTVFMETITPVGTGVERAIYPVYFRVAASCYQTPGAIDRMMIIHLSENFVRVNGSGQVQRNAKLLGCTDTLKDVHVVCDGHPAEILCGNVIIPTGPGCLLAGKQGFITMQYRLIFLVWDVSQNIRFGIAGIIQQR